MRVCRSSKVILFLSQLNICLIIIGSLLNSKEEVALSIKCVASIEKSCLNRYLGLCHINTSSKIGNKSIGWVCLCQGNIPPCWLHFEKSGWCLTGKLSIDVSVFCPFGDNYIFHKARCEEFQSKIHIYSFTKMLIKSLETHMHAYTHTLLCSHSFPRQCVISATHTTSKTDCGLLV